MLKQLKLQTLLQQFQAENTALKATLKTLGKDGKNDNSQKTTKLMDKINLLQKQNNALRSKVVTNKKK